MKSPTNKGAANGRVESGLRLRFHSPILRTATMRCALTLVIFSSLLHVSVDKAQAQTETVLYNFTGGTDGVNPASSLASDGAGNFYGTTYSGGKGNRGFGYGTVFEVSSDGSGGWNQTVLHNFCSAPGCADGSSPYFSGVIVDSAGNIYGTTELGGAYDYGVVFELTRKKTGWKETVLHSFSYDPDGQAPTNNLIMDAAGNIYGTTIAGGNGRGTVFKLSKSGSAWTEQVIYAPISGSFVGGITMDAEGNIFGIGSSKVFKLSPNHRGGYSHTAIHFFTGFPKDGSYPEGSPVLDQAGNLYGVTHSGGAKDYGTIYKLTPEKKGLWTEKILHSFQGPADITAGVVLDAAGNLYGTTNFGGKFGPGTVFELVAPVDGEGYKKKVLWNFNGADGYDPVDSLILDSAGHLYGTTWGGGSEGGGVVFEVVP
jgi:uncharacterized repeat protein (TIGR03803 family)